MFYNNQIGLVSDGKVQEFDTLHDFYRRVLELLYHDFPRGRINYKLFLYDHTMLRGEALGECCKRIERGLEGSADYCISANWTYGVQARNRQYDLIRRHVTPLVPVSTYVSSIGRGTNSPNPLMTSGNLYRLPLIYLKNLIY